MSAFDPMGYLMDCESLHLYFDGELDTVSALAFEKHLETCAQCRAELAEFREIRRHPAKRAHPHAGQRRAAAEDPRRARTGCG